jgi:hypothetical protein
MVSQKQLYIPSKYLSQSNWMRKGTLFLKIDWKLIQVDWEILKSHWTSVKLTGKLNDFNENSFKCHWNDWEMHFRLLYVGLFNPINHLIQWKWPFLIEIVTPKYPSQSIWMRKGTLFLKIDWKLIQVDWEILNSHWTSVKLTDKWLTLTDNVIQFSLKWLRNTF